MAYNEGLAERIRSKLKSTRGLAEKKMFGGVGFLVNGNMACGVQKQEMIVRLGDDEFEKALKQKGVRVFEIGGRQASKGWILVSAEVLGTERALEGWIEKGVAFAKSLPKK